MFARTVIAAIAAAALAACTALDDSSGSQEPGHSTSESSLNVPFDLGYGRTVSLTDIPLQITFAELVEDSRCPSGAMCAWEGVAVVRLHIKSGADSTSVDLDTSQRSVATAGGYKIQLEDVSPYPVSTRPQSEPTRYVVRLKISHP